MHGYIPRGYIHDNPWYQMASRLEGYGQRVAPGSAATAPGRGSTRAPYAGVPAAAAAPYYGGGYSYSAGGTSAGAHFLRRGFIRSEGGAE